jgi:hypothetical protein
MFRKLYRILVLMGLLASGSVAYWIHRDRHHATRQIAQLEQQKQALRQVVQRLSDEKRVAEIVVTDQRSEPSGTMFTTLLFVEYTRAGASLPPRTFTIEGKVAHVNAMVIKFDRHFVEEGDPLRGRSIALFTRIYGDKQAPDSASPIDSPGQIPDVYKDADPRLMEFEQGLWKDFWRLAGDAEYRREKGVRVAMGQGVWGMFEPARLYTVTLESDGGLSLSSEPMKGIYREAMRLSETR